MNGGLAPYRDRLERLASGGVVEAHLDAWAAERTGAPTGPWRPVHVRLRPQRSPWAVLVYESDGGLTVQVRLLEGREGIEIIACEADPALPGLPAVLARLEAPRVVRYRPGNRCTVQGGTTSGVRFVKVLSDAVDDQADARARWEAAASGALSFAVAEPCGWDAPTRASWYGVVPGGPLLPFLSDLAGAEMARQVGRALGELAVAPLRPARAEGAADQLARTRRGLARAAAVAPTLADGLLQAEEALTRAHERLRARPLVPVHGAAHLGQWLVDGTGRLGLVDFDRYALGDPEFDLATFCVELRAESSSLRLPVDDLEAAVIEGFREVGGEPDEGRLAVYALHKQLARVARSASALRPDAEERAARRLHRLREPLAGLAGVRE